jgi:predicted RNase H-like nuclease
MVDGTTTVASRPHGGRFVSECYPYTAIVGVAELGFDIERPRYKRQPKGMPTAQSHPLRAAACDRLITALAALENLDPPLHLRSHDTRAPFPDEPSPLATRADKHREDLIDAVICAWTGLLWLRHGSQRCQVLGLTDNPSPAGSTIVPCRPQQRRPGWPSPSHAGQPRVLAARAGSVECLLRHERRHP